MIKTRIKKVNDEGNITYYVQTKGLPRDFFSDFEWWWFLIPILNILVIIIFICMVTELLFWTDENKRYNMIESIGVFDTLEEAKHYCDIILSEDVIKAHCKKHKKKITYIKYP